MLWWRQRQLNSKNRDTRLRAVKKLSFSKKTPALDILNRALNDKDELVRWVALRGVAQISPDKEIELLVKRLKDDGIRKWASDRLVEIGDDRVVTSLLEILNDETYFGDSLKEATVVLGKIGNSRAIETLVKKLVDYRYSRFIRDLLAQSLKALGWKPTDENERALYAIASRDNRQFLTLGANAVQTLVDHLNHDDDATTRRLAANALGRIGDVRAVIPLFNYFSRIKFEDRQKEVALGPLRAIWRRNGESAIEPILNIFMSNSDKHIRYDALQCLEEMGWRPSNETEQAWSAFVFSASRPGSSWESVIELGAAAVPVLKKALEHEKDLWVKERVIESLGKIDGEQAVDALILALKDSSSTAQLRAAEALGKIRNPRAVEPLIIALQSTDSLDFSFARSMIAEALGNIGDNRAVEPLLDAFNDEYWATIHNASEALIKIGDRQAVKTLIQILKGNENAVAREQAAKALGQFGDIEAVCQLIDSLKENGFYKLGSHSGNYGGWEGDRLTEGDATYYTYYYVRDSALSSLKQITGQDFGDDSKRWLEWWQDNQGKLAK